MTSEISVLPEYAVSATVLKKWSQDRLKLTSREDGSHEAVFRFEGSTCSNFGHAIRTEFRVTLVPISPEDYLIVSSSCRPAADDEGCRRMCSYLASPETFLTSVEYHTPLNGMTLNQALSWKPEMTVAGCLCHRANQDHKWRNVIHTIHFALNHQ